MLRLVLVCALLAGAHAQNTPAQVSANGWDFSVPVSMTRTNATDTALSVNRGRILVADGNIDVSNGNLAVAAGVLQATRTAYPVVQGKRIDGSATNGRRTLSALTTRRTSTTTLFGDLLAGFGPDMSFEIEDSSGSVTELGTVAMKLNGNGHGDFAFKTWNGATTINVNQDNAGQYDRFHIFSNGNVHVPSGMLSADRTGYPVAMGRRVNDASSADRQTKSGLTTRRRSLTKTLAQMPAGFGSDISFEVEDSAGVVRELGVLGMKVSSESRRQSTEPNGDFVFKTWPQGTVADMDARDDAGEYDRLRVKSNREVEVPAGGSFTCGGTRMTPNGRIEVPAAGDVVVGGRSVKTFMNDYNTVEGGASRLQQLEDDLYRLRTAFIVLSAVFGAALLCLLCSLCYFCCGGRPMRERGDEDFPIRNKQQPYQQNTSYYEQPSARSPPPQIQYVQAKPVTMQLPVNQVQPPPQQTIQVMQHSPRMVVGPSHNTQMISQPMFAEDLPIMEPVPMMGQSYAVAY